MLEVGKPLVLNLNSTVSGTPSAAPQLLFNNQLADT
jgi:hypothetical protein